MKLHAEGAVLTVDAPEFTATFEGPLLRSLVDRRTGTEFIQADANSFPLEMVYGNADVMGPDVDHAYTVRLLSDTVASIVISGTNATRELFIRLDPETGDLCVRPNGHCSRRGVLAIRWNLPMAAEASFVVPHHGGREFTATSEPPPPPRTEWPSHWNAQLLIAQRDDATLMVHSEDSRFKYKALLTTVADGHVRFGLDSEQIGPISQNRTAGGVEWRLNTYAGGWRAAADRYRAWMDKTYELEAKRAGRPDWVNDISLAVCWVGSNQALLEPLAKLNAPARTLIHFDMWRRDPYDVNYPDYTPSPEGLAFARQASEMGFHVMPHCNYFGCCRTNPLFAEVRDWQVRDVAKNKPDGWFFPIENSDEFYQMAYIHAGLGHWRRALLESVLTACRELPTDTAFLDQTYHAWNSDNGIVENMTMLEGLHQLQEEFGWAAPDIALGGENLTEISFQRECFGQLHINGWGNLQPMHVESSHPICSYLWRGHASYIGYIEVEPENPRLDIAFDVYRKNGVIPTFIAREDVASNTAVIAPDSKAGRMIMEWVEEGVRYDA